MRPLHSFVLIACLLVFCGSGLLAQGLEQIGGPYTVDANTVLLLHFDGNYVNAAAALGKTAALAVPRTTNPAKIFFMPNTGVAGMGQCVRIDNSAKSDSSHITIEDTTSLDMTGNWTIEAWVNVTTFGATSADWRWVPRVVMKPGDAIFYQPNYWLEMWGDNRVFHAGYYTTGGSWISVTSPINMFKPGEWVHLAFIRDTARAFIACMIHDRNKQLVGFLTQGFDKVRDVPLVNRQRLHIGWAGGTSGDSWLDGFVDEVRVSNVVRNFAGPPVIQDVTVLSNQPTTAASYPVTLTAFPLNAGNRITSAVLYWRTDTTKPFSGYGMSPAGGNQFTASIPAQPFASRVQYYVKCTDDGGREAMTPVGAESSAPTFYSFLIFRPNAKTLDLAFEEGPGKTPVDLSDNKSTIRTRKYIQYSTDRPTGGGQYSLLIQPIAGEVIDSNWVEAVSPFLAAEEFTLDCWIKADSADLHATRIIINPTGEADWNNANFELSFRNGPPTNRPVFTARYWWPGGGPAVLQDTLEAKVHHVGKWRHIIMERNAKTGEFALVVRNENDQLMFRKVKTEPRPPRMAAAPLRIGRSHFLTTDYWYVPPFRGKIDNVKVFNYPAAGITTSIGDRQNEIPWAFDLQQNYPNPFNPSTQIRFTVPMFQKVTLAVFDLLGREVKTLVNEERHAGEHRVTWDGTNNAGVPVASCVYFYQLRAGDLAKTQKMLLIR